MQRSFGSAVRPPNLPADHSAEQPDHCDINPSDYMAPSGRIAESLLPKFPVITSEIVDEVFLDLPVQCLLRLSAGSRALHRRATCDDVWKQLVEAQWPGGRTLCKHNILGHSFLDAFRRHKALLSMDPAIHRGPLPDALSVLMHLGGYGVAELELFESQERGFQHGHRKKYTIPKSKEGEIIEQFKNPDQSGMYKLLEECKPARLIGGRTMHSGQGLTPENSMRTTSLALNAQAQHKLSITHADAGVLHIDESSMLQGELNHAASLRTTYARESKYKLDRNNYSSPSERYGRIAILWYSQDHLQLPPVPESSSMLAPFEGTSDEHKVGAKIFRNAELVFQFNTAMRFADKTLIQILEAMRTPGGRKLSPAQWQVLVDTERSAEQSADVSAPRPDEADWKTVALRYH